MALRRGGRACFRRGRYERWRSWVPPATTAARWNLAATALPRSILEHHVASGAGIGHLGGGGLDLVSLGHGEPLGGGAPLIGEAVPGLLAALAALLVEAL